jgi:hypothetical protein
MLHESDADEEQTEDQRMINSHVKFLQLNIAQTGIVKDAN